MRHALGLLERYRDEVLKAGALRQVFDTLPVVHQIERMYDAPWSAKQDARQFVQATAARLARWPGLARRFEQTDLEAQLDELEARRRGQLGPSIVIVAGLAISILGLAVLIVGEARSDIPPGVSIGGAGAILLGLAIAAMWFVLRRARAARLSAEAENVRRKLNVRTLAATPDALVATPDAPASPVSGAGDEYFGSLVRINVDNLSDYYTQVRVHTNNSFWASVVAGALGLLLIVAGLTIGFASDASTRSLSYVATASGVIVEFISGVFFYLYNRTVRQLKDYHDSLLDVQNILLSFRIVEQAPMAQTGPLFEKMLGFLLQQRGHGASPPSSG